MPNRVLTVAIAIATLATLAVKLVPAEWGQVLTALVLNGRPLPL